MARLATFVRVADGKNPEAWFGPDDELPSWVVEFLADNPLVWAEAPDTDDTSADVAAWLEAEAKHEADVAEWLAAEADYELEAERESAKSELEELNKKLADEKPEPARRGRPKKASTTEE